MAGSGTWALGGKLAESSQLVYASQISTLVGNPIDLLPAPGLGKAIIILSVIASLRFKTTPYQNAGIGTSLPENSEAAACYFGPSLLPACSLNSFYNLLLSTENTIQVWTSADQSSLPRTEIENCPIVLCNPAPAGAANWINGDSDLFLSILYLTIDL
jgi:hypothetical protein